MSDEVDTFAIIAEMTDDEWAEYSRDTRAAAKAYVLAQKVRDRLTQAPQARKTRKDAGVPRAALSVTSQKSDGEP